jgi:hypothetical protein
MLVEILFMDDFKSDSLGDEPGKWKALMSPSIKGGKCQ